jgi:hypothetical protein
LLSDVQLGDAVAADLAPQMTLDVAFVTGHSVELAVIALF